MSAAPQIVPSSWEVVFRQSYTKLLREARRHTRDPDLAYEAVAELWLRCSRLKPEIHTNPQAYLLTAVRREAIRQVQIARQDQGRRRVTVSGEIPIQGFDPEEEVGALELRQQLRRSLEELPEPERALFDDWLLGSPLREIEEKHGVPRQSAHRSIQRTKQKIGLRLSRRLGIALLLTLVNALLFFGTVLSAYLRSERPARDPRPSSEAALRPDPRTGERDESSVRNLPGAGMNRALPHRRRVPVREIDGCRARRDLRCVIRILERRPAAELLEPELDELIHARYLVYESEGEEHARTLRMMQGFIARFPESRRTSDYQRIVDESRRRPRAEPRPRADEDYAPDTRRRLREMGFFEEAPMERVEPEPAEPQRAEPERGANNSTIVGDVGEDEW